MFYCVKINQLIWLRTLGEEAFDSTALRQKFGTFHDLSIRGITHYALYKSTYVLTYLL